MTRIAKIFLPALALSLLAGPSAQAAAGGAETFTRSYPIHHLDLHEAEVLAWDQCPEGAGDACLVVNAGVAESGRFITVLGDAATHQRLARKLLEADAVPSTQSFQIVLLVADRGSGGDGGDLPANASRALADVREFLPFRRYRMVDATWVRTTREARAVLTGPDGLPLEVRLMFRDRVGDHLFVDRFDVSAPMVLPQEDSGEGKGRSRGRDLLSTSFAMALGETLVVGTSKLDGGDTALVVLLTAAE